MNNVSKTRRLDLQASRQRRAHWLLDFLIREAREAQAYGRVSVEVSFEAGQITVIHRKYEATEK